MAVSTGEQSLPEVPSCDAHGATVPGRGGVNACAFFAQAFGALERRADKRLIADTGLLFTRR